MIKKTSRNEARISRHGRIRTKISGTNAIPRLSIFRSLKNISAQIIDDEKGITLASVSSSDKDLKIKNGSNIDAAKIVGSEIAKKAKKAKISKVVFDRSGYLYHGRVKALADAARENGLNI